MKFRPAHKDRQHVGPDTSCSIGSIERDDALEYCRWLSDQEGVTEDQQCIVSSSSDHDSDSSWSIPPDYVLRTGYRLLDFDEWQALAHPEAEFAGNHKVDRPLLSHYSRYAANSVGSLQRGGRLLPNQFGLFDLYGNAAEWIIRKPSNDFDDPHANDLHLIGGCINSTTWQLGDNHAFGQDVPPELVGFRVARTVTPAPSDLLAQAKAYGQSGELRAAQALLEQLSQLQPDNPFFLMYRSVICTYLGEKAARRNVCGEILRRHSATEDPTVAHEIGGELVLKPDTVTDWGLVKRLAQVAARRESYPFNRSWAYVHVRMGEHERARLLLDELQKEDHGHGLVITLLFQALNYQGLRQPAESQRCTAEAEELFAELESALQPGDFGKSWRARMYCLVLFKEVRARKGSG